MKDTALVLLSVWVLLQVVVAFCLTAWIRDDLLSKRQIQVWIVIEIFSLVSVIIGLFLVFRN